MEHNYTYALEKTANPNLNITDICCYNDINLIYILCYHIEQQTKYPFIQFMMEKIPFCDNIIKEQFILPYKMLQGSNIEDDLKTITLNEVTMRLNNIGCNGNLVNETMYKGVLYSEDSVTPYVLVNITGIDIYGLHLSRNTSTWFALTSEIINTRHICNIPIDVEISDLFIKNPTIGLITNLNTNDNYMIPEAVYTGDEIKMVEFKSVFGQIKNISYDTCGEYYYFYREFKDSIKDGGWLHKNGKRVIGNRELTETSDCYKFKQGGINRYALFIEGKLYMEQSNEFTLSDNIINELYTEPCIIICYCDKRVVNPDVLVKHYNSSVCISYHVLDKQLLGNDYYDNDACNYMIK
jgi:hypothetical protein